MCGELKLPSSAIICGHVERHFGYLVTSEASSVPALQTESKRQGIFGTFNQACVRGATCVRQRHAIGRDGSLRRFWLGARRNFFANIDPAFNFNVRNVPSRGLFKVVPRVPPSLS